ncbi:MAG TPA: CDP-alcohol phosphatidyltransferase family protein [Gammaproteobacteria bacterium]|nr:CDP-alcohol phosphatidyltransferase family protein [Gammaproteobacteria bacterium]
MRFLPNMLSILRMVMVVPVIWALATGRFGVALGLFAAAGISDALDGAIAKRCGWSSRLGALLDPAADKLLVLGTYTTLAIAHRVPWWLIGLMFGRDLIIVSGAAIYRWRVGPFVIQPALTSKITTGLLIVVGIALVVQGLHPWMDAAWENVLVGLLAAALVISWLDYQLTWGIRFLRERNNLAAKREPY